jgi:xanthine dehydrogenase accessory factor
MKSLRQIIQRVREHRDQPWALATLVETRGSTYRQPGARMLVDSRGRSIGVLSGGCLESEIVERAREIVEGAPPELLEFDTRKLYGCDGCVRIFVERVGPAVDTGNVLTDLGDGLDQRELCRLRTCFAGESLGTTMLKPTELVPERAGALIHCVPLPVRLLLFGNGPEIVPLHQLAHAMGWVAHHFTRASEFPEDARPDSQTAAVVMMHHFGRDLTALHRILPLRLPYVGLLGPRKRFGQLLQELHAHPAFDPASLSTLYAPAGLDLGSEAPEEIALSIASEVSAVLADRRGGHLRDRAAAIHLVTEPRAEEHAA